MPKREWISRVEQIYRLPSGKLYARPVVPGLGRKELALGQIYSDEISLLDPKQLRKFVLARDRKVADLLRAKKPKATCLERVEDLANEVIESKRGKADATLTSAKLTIGKHLIPWMNEHAAYFDDWQDRGETLWQQYIDFKRGEQPGIKFLNHRKHLRMILLRALERGILKRRVKLYDPDPDVNVGKVLTPDEMKRLYQAAGPSLRVQLLMAYTMGMRKSEILGLEWARVDFKSGELILRRENTKTRKARTVPMTASVRAALELRFRKRKSPFVFWSRTDRKKRQGSNSSSWRQAKETAKVTARFHDLRHTFLTEAVRAGKNSVLICKYAGLSQEIMSSVYCHLDTNDLRSLAESVGENLGECLK